MRSFRRKQCLLVLNFLLAILLRERISAIQQMKITFITDESQASRDLPQNPPCSANPRLNIRRVWLWPRPPTNGLDARMALGTRLMVSVVVKSSCGCNTDYQGHIGQSLHSV